MQLDNVGHFGSDVDYPTLPGPALLSQLVSVSLNFNFKSGCVRLVSLLFGL
jgi:hypothetical protein